MDTSLVNAEGLWEPQQLAACGNFVGVVGEVSGIFGMWWSETLYGY